jgi:hypothetical protein
MESFFFVNLKQLVQQQQACQEPAKIFEAFNVESEGGNCPIYSSATLITNKVFFCRRKRTRSTRKLKRKETHLEKRRDRDLGNRDSDEQFRISVL